MVRSIFAVAAVFSVCSISLGGVMPTPEQKCEAAKLKLVGKTAGCELGIAANPKKGNDFTPCTTSYATAFSKVGTCSGDQMGLETQVGTFRSEIAAALTPNTSKCEVRKIKAAEQKLKCELFAEAKAVLVAGTADFTKCSADFAAAFMKLEAAPKEDCTTTGDETAIEDDVDAFRGTVVAEIIPSTTTTTTSSTTTTTIFPSSPHLLFPQMPDHGQPPLSRLQLVTVTFGAYPFQSFVESFGDFVVTSQWLAAVTQDFGPITATHLKPVNLHASACDPNFPNLQSVVLDNIGSRSEEHTLNSSH